MKGLVTKSTGSWYSVRLDDGADLECRIKGKFRIKGNTSTNPIAVGDRVLIDSDTDGTGIITELEPRRNYIIRKSVNLSRQGHIIASNIDQAVVFITLKQPDTPLGFVDRFLVTAEAYHIPCLLLFNKSDLLDADEKMIAGELMNEYEQIGYHCMLFSTQNDDIQPLRELFHNKVTLISGQSGAGKTSFINALEPGLQLRTGSISDYHGKGMHTTTFAEMFPLENGGWIIDTPGIKGFGLIDMEKGELADYFPEIRALKAQCKFSNCQHLNDACFAVKKAVDEGSIWENRYMNYLSIRNDDEDETYRGKGY